MFRKSFVVSELRREIFMLKVQQGSDIKLLNMRSAELNQLEKDFTAQREELESLKKSYHSLKKQYSVLEKKYDSLVFSNSDLQRKYDFIFEDFDGAVKQKVGKVFSSYKEEVFEELGVLEKNNLFLINENSELHKLLSQKSVRLADIQEKYDALLFRMPGEVGFFSVPEKVQVEESVVENVGVEFGELASYVKVEGKNDFVKPNRKFKVRDEFEVE